MWTPINPDPNPSEIILGRNIKNNVYSTKINDLVCFEERTAVSILTATSDISQVWTGNESCQGVC
jgi:hypothetical protein